MIPTCKRCISRMKNNKDYGFYRSLRGGVIHVGELGTTHTKTLCAVDMYGWKQVGRSYAP